MKLIFFVAALLLLAAPLSGNQIASAQEHYTMKLGTATLHDAQEHWMDVYKQMVERDSHGRIEVQVYPASQLGSIPREVEDTQFGAIQGWVGPPEFLLGVDPRYQVFGTPGLFTSFAQMNRVIHDPTVQRTFLDLGFPKGLKGISLWIDGSNWLFTRKPVTLNTTAGLKVRVLAGASQEAELSAFGMTAVPMPLDQVLPGLQQGTIDGTLTNVQVATPLKYSAVAPYALAVNQPYIADIVVISKQWYDQLPPDLQKIVVDDGRRAGDEAYGFMQGFRLQQTKAWLAQGGKITHLTPAEQASLRAKVANLGEQVYKDNPPVFAAYRLVKATVDRLH